MKDFKKVLAIDTNPNVAYRYLSLLPVFKKNDFEIVYLILQDIHCDSNNQINGLQVKSFSNYSSKNYLEILNIEKPDVVMFLSMNNLLIRSFNRCCKFLNIPTLLMQHGIISNSELTNTKRHDSKKFYVKRIKRIIKGELLKSYFIYLNYLFLTKAKISTIKFFFYESILKILNKDFPTEDWQYSAYGVFIKADKKKLIDLTYNTIDKNKIYIVGNYDLIHFNLDIDSFNSYKKDNNNKNILYFDSDCVHRTFNRNLNEYLKYISSLNKIIIEKGLKLVVKLHPYSLKIELNKHLSNLGINCIEKDELKTYLLNSRYVISEASSIMSIACLTGVPVITPTIKPFSSKKYGSLINSYPNRFSFNSFKEFEKIIKNNYSLGDKKLEVEKWIDEFAGPLPPSDFSKRVLNIIQSII